MITQVFDLWNTVPGHCEETPIITHYCPDQASSDGAIVIFPGGGYHFRAPHEGEGYAKFLAGNGFHAFVVDYRVAPHTFPLPLLDARRGIQFVRYHAEKFGVDKKKIAVMGSSAGGHLAALVSTCTEPLAVEKADAVDAEDYRPNKQILCYPVINLYDTNICHRGSGDCLLGKERETLDDIIRRRRLTPSLLADETAPEAFIWHTFEDAGVSVQNSLEYASRLREYGVPTELHIFPHGVHGLGLTARSNALENHVAQWSDLLLHWLRYWGW